MIRFITIVTMILMALALLVRCGTLGFHRWTWHQKLTVVVDTPNGPKTASSVVAVNWEKTPGFLKGLGGGGYSGRLTGNVVAVEVAPSRYLFTLFDNRYGAGTALDVFLRPKRGWSDQSEEKALFALQQGSQQQTLSPEYYPNFVTFRDIADPSSVEPVLPRDFEKAFGKGVVLASVTLSVTDEKRTDTNFAEILPWWNNYKRNKQFDGDRYTYLYSSNRFANSLNSTNFKKD